MKTFTIVLGLLLTTSVYAKEKRTIAQINVGSHKNASKISKDECLKQAQNIVEEVSTLTDKVFFSSGTTPASTGDTLNNGLSVGIYTSVDAILKSMCTNGIL